MKNYSLIKLLILNLYILLGVFILAVIGTGAGLAATLSVSEVINGWKDMFTKGDAGEVFRMVGYFIFVMTIPFSQGIVEDRGVAKFKKFITFSN